MSETALTSFQDIYSEIKQTLLISRNQAYSAVNYAMVQAGTSGVLSWSMSKTEASVRNTEKVCCSGCQSN